MAEDVLGRYHIPGESEKIRGLAETGIKDDWENIFHPEELQEDESLTSIKQGRFKERLPGGGEGALDSLFTNPDSVDPELKLMYSEFLDEVYSVADHAQIMEFLLDEKNRLTWAYSNLLGIPEPTAQQEKTKQRLLKDIEFADMMMGGGLEIQIRGNFIKWFNTDEEEVSYDLTGIPRKILERLEERKHKSEQVGVTAHPDRLKNPETRAEMTYWLNAWKDPQANIEAMGIMYENGTVKSVALKSEKYGVTPVDFRPWKKCLGGQNFSNVIGGTQTTGVNFGKGHVIAPGIRGTAIRDTVRTLTIDGASHPDLEVVLFRK
jgi:hypothetical protein